MRCPAQRVTPEPCVYVCASVHIYIYIYPKLGLTRDAVPVQVGGELEVEPLLTAKYLEEKNR